MNVERCASLVGAIFGGLAMFAGPQWVLTPTERDVLASTLAETLENAPDTLVAGVSRMSAPVALVGELGLVVGKRLAAGADAQQRPAAPPPRPQSVPDPPRPPRPPPQGPQPGRTSDAPTILIPAAAIEAGAMMDNGLPNGVSPYG